MRYLLVSSSLRVRNPFEGAAEVVFTCDYWSSNIWSHSSEAGKQTADRCDLHLIHVNSEGIHRHLSSAAMQQ